MSFLTNVYFKRIHWFYDPPENEKAKRLIFRFKRRNCGKLSGGDDLKYKADPAGDADETNLLHPLA